MEKIRIAKVREKTAEEIAADEKRKIEHEAFRKKQEYERINAVSIKN
jgi:hypothetical protein